VAQALLPVLKVVTYFECTARSGCATWGELVWRGRIASLAAAVGI